MSGSVNTNSVTNVVQDILAAGLQEAINLGAPKVIQVLSSAGTTIASGYVEREITITQNPNDPDELIAVVASATGAILGTAVGSAAQVAVTLGTIAILSTAVPYVAVAGLYAVGTYAAYKLGTDTTEAYTKYVYEEQAGSDASQKEIVISSSLSNSDPANVTSADASAMASMTSAITGDTTIRGYEFIKDGTAQITAFRVGNSLDIERAAATAGMTVEEFLEIPGNEYLNDRIWHVDLATGKQMVAVLSDDVIHFETPEQAQTQGQEAPVENPIATPDAELAAVIEQYKSHTSSGVVGFSRGVEMVGYLGMHLYIGNILVSSNLHPDQWDKWYAIEASPRYLYGDPIVLDLDGDGIELIGADEGVFFNTINADNMVFSTGWAGGDDGMLAIDLNSNGKIDNAEELFQTQTSTPLATLLASYDTDTNNILNSNDTAWGSLRVWKDTNENGITDSGELFTLGDLLITSINLTGSNNGTVVEGNTIDVDLTFVMDGNTEDAAAVTFGGDTANSRYVGSYDLKLETLFLPQARGYGLMPNLHIAMSNDTTLLGMVRDFADLAPTDAASLKPDVQDILLRWAGVDGDDDDINGSEIDSRIVHFMNKIAGVVPTLTDTVEYDSGSASNMKQQFNAIVERYTLLLAVQGPLAELFPNVVYSFADDTLDLGVSDLGDLLTAADSAAPTDDDEAAYYWSYVRSALNKYGDVPGANDEIASRLADLAVTFAGTYTAPEFPDGQNLLVGTTGADTINAWAGDDIIFAGEGNNSVVGGDGSDVVIGGSGNETLSGGDGDDVIYGFAGNDFLNGQGGDDLVFGGDGVDVIDGGTGDDRLYGEAGNDTLYGRDGNDSLSGDAGTDTIYGGDGDDDLFGGDGDDALMGDTADSSDTAPQAVGADYLDGGAGSDYLYGDKGDDILIGGADNDYLYGGTGSDEYRFAAGDGVDLISDQVTGGDENTITFTDVTSDQVTLSQSGNHLRITNGSDQVTVNNWYLNTSYRMHSIAFADDITISATEAETVISSMSGSLVTTVNGTSGADSSLTGTAWVDHINGLAGNDLVWAGAGNDVIDGGSGNDTLRGEAGGDTYLFNLGNNTDRIVDSYEAGKVNKVIFGTGIYKADLKLYRESASSANLVIENTTNGDKLIINDWNASDKPMQAFEFVESGQSLSVAEATVGYNTIYGTASANSVEGDAADNTIYGLAGNDTIYGAEGNDILYGGDDGDVLYGDKNASMEDVGSGNDTLIGGSGNDALWGGAGDDILDGGGGNDTLRGEAGSDTYIVNLGYNFDNLYDSDADSQVNTIAFGDDIFKADLKLYRDNSFDDALMIENTSNGDKVRIRNWVSTSPIQAFTFTESGQSLSLSEANVGYNTLYGTSGGNTINGGSEDNIIYGLEGNDALNGNDGNDVLHGGDGNDNLNGGAGNDTFYGGAGDDTLAGDLGDDTYHFGRGDGTDSLQETPETNSDTDRVFFGNDVDFDQVWFWQDGSALKAKIIGTSDILTMYAWYNDSDRHVEEYYSGDGKILLKADMDTLVQAMSGYSVPTGSNTEMDSGIRTALDTTLTAVWQNAA